MERRVLDEIVHGVDQDIFVGCHIVEFYSVQVCYYISNPLRIRIILRLILNSKYYHIHLFNYHFLTRRWSLSSPCSSPGPLCGLQGFIFWAKIHCLCFMIYFHVSLFLLPMGLLDSDWRFNCYASARVQQ